MSPHLNVKLLEEIRVRITTGKKIGAFRIVFSFIYEEATCKRQGIYNLWLVMV